MSPHKSLESFDYRTATEAEIMDRARPMAGRRLGELLLDSGPDGSGAVSGATTRGTVGAIAEGWFGKKPDQDPEPDFPGAGIELKTVPLELTTKGWKVKERTYITAIDYMQLPTETWDRASVRKKLSKVLLVFYKWVPQVPMLDFEVSVIHLWKPDERQLAFMGRDWREVRARVDGGDAHLLSESDTNVLAAATKAADGSRRRPQPRSDIQAKPRSWAIKKPIMRTVYAELRTKGGLESLIETLGLPEAETFEEQVLDRYAAFVGRTVGDLAREFGVDATGKHYVARVARKALGQGREGQWAREFGELGIEVKTVVARHDAMPYEHMSFPRFRYLELVEEEWNDSDLRGRIGRFLFLPFEGKKGLANAPELVVRTPFFWVPSEQQVSAIGEEWVGLPRSHRSRRGGVVARREDH